MKRRGKRKRFCGRRRRLFEAQLASLGWRELGRRFVRLRVVWARKSLELGRKQLRRFDVRRW